MHFSILAVAACAASANAFKNTSPFLMISNKQFPDSLSSVSTAQLQSSSSVLQAAKDVISKCDSEKYYIVTQPELTSSSLARNSPHLRNLLNDKSTKSSLAVSEVVGLKAGDREELVKLVEEKCGAVVDNKFVDRARYGAREMATKEWEVAVGGWTDSEKKLGKSDPGLQANVLKDLATHHSYTFILLSTPATNVEEDEDYPVYEAIFDDAVHMDLKRNLYARKRNSTGPADPRPLFEKYQFLTPGLFMGLLVGVILLSILGVGLNAIASLEVSYGAFEKEMGPQAQKKAQ